MVLRSMNIVIWGRSNNIYLPCCGWIIMLNGQLIESNVHMRENVMRAAGDETHMLYKYCKTRKFSRDKFSLISPSQIFRSFNSHYSMTVLFYIITKVNILEAFNFHRFASSAKIAKINCGWNCLVLHYVELFHQFCAINSAVDNVDTVFLECY